MFLHDDHHAGGLPEMVTARSGDHRTFVPMAVSGSDADPHRLFAVHTNRHGNRLGNLPSARRLCGGYFLGRDTSATQVIINGRLGQIGEGLSFDAHGRFRVGNTHRLFCCTDLRLD